MSDNTAKKKAEGVKHTLAGITIAALGSALTALYIRDFELSFYLLLFGVIVGILYFVKEFPYWFQKILDVWMFYTQIKPIKEAVMKQSPKIDTSRQAISSALQDIENQIDSNVPLTNMEKKLN